MMLEAEVVFSGRDFDSLSLGFFFESFTGSVFVLGSSTIINMLRQVVKFISSF